MQRADHRRQRFAAGPLEQRGVETVLRFEYAYRITPLVRVRGLIERVCEPADLRRLERAGLRVSTVSGVFVFVRGRARAFPTVARFSSVQYISLSRPATTQDSTFRARVSPTSGGSS